LDEYERVGSVSPTALDNLLKTITSNADPQNEEEQKLVGRALALVNKVNAKGRTVHEFNPLLATLSKIVNAWEHLFTVLARMKKAGLEPDEKTYKELIRGCFTNEKDAAFFEILRIMEAQNLVPSYDLFFSSIWEMAHSPQRKETKVQRLLTRMKLASVPPDRKIFEAIVHGYLAHNRLTLSVEALESMKNYNLTPSLKMYNMILNYIVKHPAITTAVRLILRMRQEGQIVDERPISIIFGVSYKVTSSIVQASQMLQQARQENEVLAKDVTIFNCFLRSCFGRGQAGLNQFKQALDEVDSGKITPNIHTFQLMMKYYIKLGQPDIAFNLIDKMKYKYNLEMEGKDWMGLLHYLLQANQKPHALALKQMLEQKGLFWANASVYRALLKMCVKRNDNVLGKQIIMEMRKRKVEADARTNKLINLIGDPELDRDELTEKMQAQLSHALHDLEREKEEDDEADAEEAER
jgi:hypothetical protein